MAQIHGGQIVARSLKAQGVDTIFVLTGGHIVPILDGALKEGIRVVDVRHEQSAAHAAEAYTRLTGNLGVAVVTAGPGVTGTITGVATAEAASTPMLVIGGRHMRHQEGKGGLQEMDHPRLFESITRWAGTASQVDRIADSVTTATRHAFAGRGGPVFLDIPMDVQFDQMDESAVGIVEGHPTNAGLGADEGTLDQVVAALAEAARVMIFAGAGPSTGQDSQLADLAEALQAPVYVNGRARGSVPHGHPLLGNYSRSAAMSGAELVLAFGVDWDFRAGYGERLSTDAVVIHVDLDETKIGWNRPAQIGLVADPVTAVSQLVARADEFARHDLPVWTKEILDGDLAKSAAVAAEADDDSSPVTAQRFGRDVAEFFGTDSIVAMDGGDIVSTTARWLQISTAGHVLDPGPFGTLGVGPGYAIAAKTVFPDKTVGIVFGDGAFGFNGMEYDTMVRLGLPIIGVVGNDGVWSNIKTFHRLMYPEEQLATDLGVRPYHEMVNALGGYGEFVDDPADIRPALERARESGLPALINVHIGETMRMSSNYSQ